MSGSEISPTKSIRVYRNEPDFTDYLTARHGPANQDRDIFEFRGATWRFSHSSTDAKGMFDVLHAVKGTARR